MGGRRQKCTKNRGRPCNAKQGLIAAIIRVQPPSLHPPGSTPEYTGVHESLVCCICLEVLNQPILLPCNELVCGPCCSYWVAVSKTASCPCCYSDAITSEGVYPPPSAVLDLLGGLILSCIKCKQQVKAAQFLTHLNSKCGTHALCDSPSELTVGQILNTPSNMPPSTIEKKAMGKIIKRFINTTPESAIIRVPTGGQVRSYTIIQMNYDYHAY